MYIWRGLASVFFSVAQFNIWHVAIQQPVLLAPAILCSRGASLSFWNVAISGRLVVRRENNLGRLWGNSRLRQYIAAIYLLVDFSGISFVLQRSPHDDQKWSFLLHFLQVYCMFSCLVVSQINVMVEGSPVFFPLRTHQYCRRPDLPLNRFRWQQFPIIDTSS